MEWAVQIFPPHLLRRGYELGEGVHCFLYVGKVSREKYKELTQQERWLTS